MTLTYLGKIDFESANIKGNDFPVILKIPGFDKVLQPLFALFDALDLNTLIAERSAEFPVGFFGYALLG